ncbi:hypothetical protein GWI33_021089 [Rhynchophorus ferrugineus]|uniref:Odorant receptor n=1 Tax=Rhynchophorus ferrugineus TaxID=354439 RepID=A0A834M2S9_RHYFE|nr:hypothetical protein GWI33_021089 [Rhynchophorus ferrugineus]
MYEPKKGEMFYSTLTSLRWFYLYPSKKDSENWKLYAIKAVIVRIITSFGFIECWLHLIMSIIENAPVNLAEDIEGITGYGNSVFVCCMFQYMCTDWSTFFKDLTDVIRFGKPPEYDNAVKKTNLFSSLYYVFTTVSVILYGIVSFFDTKQCKLMNERKGTHEICDAVTPLWWPSAYMNPWVKAFITAYLLLSCEYYLPASGVVSVIVWESTILIEAKINHLKVLFKDCLNDDDPTRKREKLNFCIRYHLEIYRLCDEINRLSKWIIGQLSFAAAIVIGCIANQMIKQYSVGSMFHLVGYTIVVFLACHTGQIIKNKTYDIQDALYESKWIDVDREMARDVQFVILRCQTPAVLKAIPLGTFDYSVWIVILKTSYSYVTLLTKQA